MLTFSTYTAAQPLLQARWGLSATQAGAIFAAQQAGYTVAVLILSTLTDTLGVRRIYLFSTAWSAVAGVLFALGARDFASALMLRTLMGVGLAGTYMPGVRLVAESVPAHRRGTALGIFIACFSVGAATSLLLASWLLPLGVRSMLLLTSLGPLAALAVAWWIVRDVPRPSHHAAPGRAAVSSFPFGAALGNRAAMRFIGAYAAHNWELFGMRAWVPIFLTALWVDRGRSLADATRLGAAAGSAILLAGAASNAAGGWLSDRWGRSRTIILFLAASALCSAAMGWLRPLGLGIVFVVGLLYGLLTTADSSTLSTAVAEAARPGTLGTTMAVQSSIGFVATIISPVLFGAVLDRTGWGWAFLSLGIGAAAGVALVPRSWKGTIPPRPELS
jgi:MFS family permease